MKCAICGLEFSSLIAGRNHLRLHKISSKDYYNTYIKNDKCEICAKIKNNCIYCLPDIIDNPIQCKICGLNTTTSQALSRHLNSHKNITKHEYYIKYIKNDKCSNCSKNQNNCIHCLPDIINNSIQCKICGLNTTIRALGNHLYHSHKNITLKEYYDKYLRKPNEGICVVCGKETKFLGITRGYNRTCSIHCKNLDPITQEKRKQSCLAKYGVESHWQSKDVREKVKKTCLAKYGVESVLSAPKVKEKIKQTNLEKYGVENVFQNKEIKEKIKQTNLEKYGTEYALASDKIKEKSKQTSLIKYGTENPGQSKQAKEKREQTNLERYGVTTPAKSDKIKEKIKQTNLIKYGVESPFQSDYIKEKSEQTKLQKYGDKHYNNGNKISNTLLSKTTEEKEKTNKKRKDTSLQKYSVEHPMQSSIVQEHIKKTNIKRYGKENIYASDYGKQQIKHTVLDKYGVEYIGQSKYAKDKINKSKKENKNLDSEINDPDE